MGRLTSAFLRNYPEMRIEVTAEDRFVDLVEEGYDLVVRINPSVEASLVGRCFFRDTLVLAASPGLRPPKPGEPVPSVGLTPATLPTWHVLIDGIRREVRHEPVLILSAWSMIKDAVSAGAGAALMPRSVVDEDLAAGRLVSWGDAIGGEVEMWALYPSRRLLNSRVSAFMQFLLRTYRLSPKRHRIPAIA